MEHNQFLQLVENAINAFEKQGQFSRGATTESKCFYSRNGLCCIVGHMMPDEAIRVNADSQPSTSILSLYGSDFEWTKQFNRTQIDLLHALQGHHDTNCYMDEALTEMRYSLHHYRVDHE
jgi:hypothetical protein